jgi:hypothetical protein
MTRPGDSVNRSILVTFGLTLALLAILCCGASPSRAQTGADSPVSGFQGRSQSLPPEVAAEVKKYSWRSGCPVPLEDLAYLELSYLGFDGQAHLGRLIVHKSVASEVLDIFRDLFEARFPVERMELIDYYQGSDDASMADNNTSAFNCRPVTGGGGFSRHSYGLALDINPLLNPYIKADLVLPPAGKAYVNRDQFVPGLIVEGDACHQALVSRGWEWGGGWQTRKDYQHFEKRTD